MSAEAAATGPPRRADAAATAARALTLLLTAFVLFEVNRPAFSPQTGLAVFGLLGLPLSFLARRASPGGARWRRVVDGVGLASAAAGCAWVLWWSGFAEQTLGDRAGGETDADIVFGILGLLGALIAAWRALGPALPVLTGLFVLHAALGPSLPDFLFPHRGYSLSRIASQGFLHTQGVFGIAMRVMFAYVFLFVVFGAVLQETGAIRFITASSRRLFRGTVGGAAKVSVFANALMGSLSGSAVADAATTGSFTIPMMRSTGFSARLAAGITAAASSGAALVPPVMGAGAYMMLELVDPPVRYLEVIRAAVLPAILYYAALLLTVHLSVRRRPLVAPSAPSGGGADDDRPPLPAALVFGAGFASLLGALLAGRTVFRAVSIALAVVVVASLFHPDTRPRLRSLAGALDRIARGAAPLVAAAAAVGVILGMVTLTGVGTRFPAAILSVADGSLLPALVLIMVGSVVLGMGLPSAVCYLLMVTLIGPVIGRLGVPALSVHFFIFYFGMMSMVTPPVALAAYTTAGIAGTPILPAATTAFRFALAGFALPYFFVYRPELLLLLDEGRGLPGAAAAVVLGLAVVAALSIGITGFCFGPLRPALRALSLLAAALLLWPPGGQSLFAAANFAGILLLVAIAWVSRRTPAPAAIQPGSS